MGKADIKEVLVIGVGVFVGMVLSKLVAKYIPSL